eukprot:scaffold20432_cov108-Cylindrotheca_fusiformis.AAC.2
MEEGNYSKFCGKNNDGVKKAEFCRSLAHKMTEETTSVRDAKNVLNKIQQHVEKKFHEAHNFATSETGAGLHQAEDPGTFEDAVKRKCPYYCSMRRVAMQSTGSSKPRALRTYATLLIRSTPDCWHVHPSTGVGPECN